MTKADIPVMPQFFDRYINLVDNTELITALTQADTFDKLMPSGTMEAIADMQYAPGKWTGKDILQHLIDTERIMAYRALRFARNDQTHLPGFDENLFGEFAQASHRTIADLYDEYTLVRQSSIRLFQHFDETMLLRSGTASGKTISVLALGFMLVGHPIHHVNVIHERYLPLL